MRENKDEVLVIRVTGKEKRFIERTALQCGFTVSEYLRQRALGYKPRAIQPGVFNDFYGTLCDLIYFPENKISEEVERKILLLLDRIDKEFLTPGKEERYL